MNSEELEVSLRSEFESYLKNMSADMRQEISQLQERIEADIESYKSQLSGIFQEVMTRAEQERELDAGFRESVVEHLRLARDEGASITATAIAEAEEMEKQRVAEAEANAVPKVGIRELHQAVNEISAKQSQAEILKTLVQHAGQFTPRGAFFIVKNEHFVGWRIFGAEMSGVGDESVREVFLPVTGDSLLSEAYRSLVVVESNVETFADDAGTLQRLGFEGSPERMYAIPLVVRGRAVAVLYTDYGTQGGEVNIEALETLVRVASLTVEVLASAKTASAKEQRRKLAPAFAGSGVAAYVPAAIEQEPKESASSDFSVVPNYDAPQYGENSYQSSFEGESFADSKSSFDEQSIEQQQPSQQYSSFVDYRSEPVQEEQHAISYQQEVVSAPEQQSHTAYEEQSWNQTYSEPVTEVNADSYAGEQQASDYVQDFSTEQHQTQDYSTDFYTQPANVETSDESDNAFSVSESETPVTDYQFDAGQSNQASSTESFQSYEQSPQAESYLSPVNEERNVSFETAPSPQVEEASFRQPAETVSQPTEPTVSATPPVKSRFSERNVDLPIEVTEDERRLHNDARRFARLLVSEIKLYNEQKVKEGRESSDLYDRLREAIDRSREMYDKRVQPPVAAKFDYFHYELVNSLADGDSVKLGSDYPGASV